MLALLLSVAIATEGYQEPPEAIATILDAPYPPGVSLSPDGAWMLELERPSLPPLAELAEPQVKVAGIKLNPDTNGPAREYAYRGITLRDLAPVKKSVRRTVALPEGARVRNIDWSFDSQRFSFTNTVADGVELWVVDVTSGEATKLVDDLNAAWGSPCSWLPADEGLICRVVDPERGEAPAAPTLPAGPTIDENLGRKTPARTYTNLLENAHDEALFEHYLTSVVVHVALDGTVSPMGEPGLVSSAVPSPDGAWLLIREVHRPFSYHVPASRFPATFTAVARDQSVAFEVADLPLADDVPIPFGSTRKGRRSVGWRGDQPATLWWVEALDEGDAGKEVELRDEVSTLAAPFDGEPVELWKSKLRFGGISWGDDGFAIAEDWWYSTRQTRRVVLDPSDPEAGEKLVFERSYQDQYSDPGDPVYVQGPHGWGVVYRDEDGRVYLDGAGHTPEGQFPFVDAWDPESGETERIWQAEDPWLESFVDLLPDGRFVTRRQSGRYPPNYVLRTPGKNKATMLTDFEDWAPAFADVQKEVITYEREDGLPLSATVYFPPGYNPKKDGPRPALFWAYPNEFKSRDDAGQVTATAKRFTRPYGSSHLFMLLEGYIVVDDPSIPIVGEGDEQPNDTFIEQLVAGAEAAVKATAERGWVDPERTVVGGHSYGAFMTAHLLAHSDLFRAGIARSGAYNRSLTPWGFQGEERSYWEALDTYTELSPFTHAAKIDEPLLMIHGADDSNSGTYPIQSERMFEAIKGMGGTVRWVELPYEDHGYRARQSVGHVLWEMVRWSDEYVKNAGPRETEGPPAE